MQIDVMKILNDPAMQMGLGILGGSKGSYGNFGTQMSQGVASGNAELRKLQDMEMKKKQFAQQQATAKASEGRSSEKYEYEVSQRKAAEEARDAQLKMQKANILKTQLAMEREPQARRKLEAEIKRIEAEATKNLQMGQYYANGAGKAGKTPPKVTAPTNNEIDAVGKVISSKYDWWDQMGREDKSVVAAQAKALQAQALQEGRQISITAAAEEILKREPVGGSGEFNAPQAPTKTFDDSAFSIVK